MDKTQNLIPFTSEQDREKAKINGKKGGKASGEAKRAKKTLAQIVQEWGNKEASEHNKSELAKIGITGESATQKATLIIPLLNNVKAGNIKAITSIMELLQENNKYEAEIEKIKAETERIKLENEQLKALQTATTDEKTVLDKLVEQIARASK